MIETRYEIHSNTGVRIQSHTDLNQAIVACREVNLGRDEAAAYVVVQVLVPVPVGT